MAAGDEDASLPGLLLSRKRNAGAVKIQNAGNKIFEASPCNEMPAAEQDVPMPTRGSL